MNTYSQEQTITDSLNIGFNQHHENDDCFMLPIIPKPQKVSSRRERLKLSGYIVCNDSVFQGTVQHFLAELNSFTKRVFQHSEAPAQPGDIIVIQNSQIKCYTLTVTDSQAILSAPNTDALIQGEATLLQLLIQDDTQLPCMDLEDWPDSSYRGVMLDLGRRPHTMKTLHNIIRMCAVYKMNVLHLHLSDTELYSFASEHFPDFDVPGATLSTAQWRELEEFSAQCGVTLLPELDLPGHATFFLTRNPSLRCDPPNNNTVCLGQPVVFDFLNILLDELCQVFKRTPWIHIGADEANTDGWKNCRHCQQAMRQKGWTDPQELYRNFIVKANELVKAHGKRTIVWEGFRPQGQVDIPRDVIVMVFESLYHLPGDLVKEGYEIINTSWQPLYLEGTQIAWPPCHIFNWNKFRWENWWEKSAAHPNGLVISPTPQVLGASLCTWGVPDQDEIPLIHPRLAALAEQLWNPSSRNFRNFQQRYNAIATILSKQFD